MENEDFEVKRAILSNKVNQISAEITILKNKLNRYKKMNTEIENGKRYLVKANKTLGDANTKLKANYKTDAQNSKTKNILTIKNNVNRDISALGDIISKAEEKMKELQIKIDQKETQKRNLEAQLNLIS